MFFRNLHLRLAGLIILSLISFADVSGTNSLVARVPNIPGQQPAYIKNALLVAEPHGAYVEQALYLEYTDNYAFPGSNSVEIIHRFEMPEGAVINDLWLWIGDQVMQGLILDVWKARSIYDSIVAMKRDPAFLTKKGNQYELHVYPLVSGMTRKIKLNFITPAQWNGNIGLAELPLKFLKASNDDIVKLDILFRTRQDIWGQPSIPQIPGLGFYHYVDTMGYKYKKTYILNVKSYQDLNLAFSPEFTNGAYFNNNFIPRDKNYFQFAFVPYRIMSINDIDSSSKKVVIGIDLGGSQNKNYPVLIPNLKSSINSALKQNDKLNIYVAGAARIKNISGGWRNNGPGVVDTILNAFVSSPYADSIQQEVRSRIIYSDANAVQMWSFTDINSFAVPQYYNTIVQARNYFNTAEIVTSYNHGHERLLTTNEAQLVLQSLDSLFSRGGKFLTYWDLNRQNNLEKLVTHYIPSLSIEYRSSATKTLYRTPDGNISGNFPESFDRAGSYFFKYSDSTVKKELVDANGYPCLITKRLGNNGLLIVSGMWSFNDDQPLRRMLAIALMGLNQSASEEMYMLTKLLENIKSQHSGDSVNTALVFSNCDSLVTSSGAAAWVNAYRENFVTAPRFKSVNLLDGSVIMPPSVTVLGSTYYGSGYLMKALANISRGLHFETHTSSWSAINQQIQPELRPIADTITLVPQFQNPTDSLYELREVVNNPINPEQPVVYIGSTNTMAPVTMDVNIKFIDIPDTRHYSSQFAVSLDTTLNLRIIKASLGNELLKEKFLYSSADTAGIVATAVRNNLLSDYTAFLCLEPNDTIHPLTNPYDETRIPVELTSCYLKSDSGRVSIYWETATELNNRGYRLDKICGGRTTTVGHLPGKGTTLTPSKYVLHDMNISASDGALIRYYLYQQDYDGTERLIAELEYKNNVLPAVFALAQNYPNPFNPETIINYQIPMINDQSNAVRVTLIVYDILGNVVATLVNETKPAGSYSVSFNASNLPSGVYIYRMQAGSFTDVKKLTIIK